MNQVPKGDGGLSTLVLRRQGVVRALKMMRLRLASQISLELLAKTAAMSPFHFERVFQQLTGLRPFQFLSAMRLVRAREMVLTTDAPITAICFDVGYNSVGTFTRRFTASVGVSPRGLRRFFLNRQELTLDTQGAANVNGADIVVHCRGVAEGTLIFIGAFPSPVPMGRPKACATMVGTGTVVLPDVPPGRHYVLAAACPASATSDSFGSVETLIGIADPAPVQIERQSRQEVTMQLRPIEVTDPPIVSCLPLLFQESCARPLLNVGSPNDPAVTGAQPIAR